MTDTYEITLDQMLKAREDRAEKQKELIEKFGTSLISFTVNMPGSRKKTPVSERVFEEGSAVLIYSLVECGMSIICSETRYLVSGPEAYFAVHNDATALKKFLIQIEDQHSLGRLFDFDVIGQDGNAVSRETLGYPKRRCLLCKEDAHVCARSKRHPLEKIEKKINEITEEYFNYSESI